MDGPLDKKLNRSLILCLSDFNESYKFRSENFSKEFASRNPDARSRIISYNSEVRMMERFRNG